MGEIIIYQRGNLPPATGSVAKTPYELADNNGAIRFGETVERLGGGLMEKIVRSQIDNDIATADVAMTEKWGEYEKWVNDNPDMAMDEAQNLTKFNNIFNNVSQEELAKSSKTPDGRKAVTQQWNQFIATRRIHAQNAAFVQAVRQQEVSVEANLEKWSRLGASSSSDTDNKAALAAGYKQLQTASQHKLLNMHDTATFENRWHDFVVRTRAPFIMSTAVSAGLEDESKAGKVIDDMIAETEATLGQIDKERGGLAFKFLPDEIDTLKKHTRIMIQDTRKLSDEKIDSQIGQWNAMLVKNEQQGKNGESLTFINNIDISTMTPAQQTKFKTWYEQNVDRIKTLMTNDKFKSDPDTKIKVENAIQDLRRGKGTEKAILQLINANRAKLSNDDYSTYSAKAHSELVAADNNLVNEAVTYFETTNGKENSFAYRVALEDWLIKNPTKSARDKYIESKSIANQYGNLQPEEVDTVEKQQNNPNLTQWRDMSPKSKKKDLKALAGIKNEAGTFKKLVTLGFGTTFNPPEGWNEDDIEKAKEIVGDAGDISDAQIAEFEQYLSDNDKLRFGPKVPVPPGMVRVISPPTKEYPNGRRGFVKQSELEAAITEGYTEVE